MGNSCSHEQFDIMNKRIEPYNDNTNTWSCVVADAVCKNCTKPMRVIQKTCLDHNIKQPWEMVDKLTCKHDNIIIKNSQYDDKNDIFKSRAECVACLTTAPAYAYSDKIYQNGELKVIRPKKWEPDRKELLREISKK